MIEDLRQQANAAPFEEPDHALLGPAERPQKLFLGMTPAQRFVIAFMLLLITCLLSAFCLLVTERVVLPLV